MTAFVVKLIAIIIMFIDHLGAVFPEYFPFAFRIIGRAAFPLFVYLIAEGCRYTRSMPRFLLRLFIFAMVSQIPFDIALRGNDINFLYNTNIFYTLTLGVVVVYAYQYLSKRYPGYALYLSVTPLFIAMCLAEWLGTDYGAFGVAFIFTMYVITSKKLRLVAMAAFCILAFREIAAYIWISVFIIKQPDINPENVALIVFCLLSVPLVALYNGKRGPEMKWLFYFFYPVHLLVLGVVRAL